MLAAQLQHAKGPVGVVFQLEIPKGGDFPTPAQVDANVRKVIEAASESSGCAPENLVVFENLNAFSVQADPGFVMAAIKNPRVAQAAPTAVQEDVLIRPAETKQVPLPRGQNKHHPSRRRGGR